MAQSINTPKLSGCEHDVCVQRAGQKSFIRPCGEIICTYYYVSRLNYGEITGKQRLCVKHAEKLRKKGFTIIKANETL